MRAPEFWSHSGAIPALLSPFAGLYSLGGLIRQKLTRPQQAPVPVICIGNLVVGGAGKTPVALAVIERLQAAGRDVHALTRGYGGREPGPIRVEPEQHSALDVGDEALLLAQRATTWVSRDRPSGALAAAAAGAEIIVMDDGFQNPSLHKDLSIIVVDGGFGLGNGRVLPAGPLREPAHRGLTRANAAIVLGAAEPELIASLAKALPQAPIEARLLPKKTGQELAGKRVLAFAGIGRPEKFYATLRELSLEITETRDFPDHHPYTDSEIGDLLQRADARNAIAITTEKDAVRLSPRHRARIATLPIEIEWQDQMVIDRLLEAFTRGSSAVG